MAYDLRCCNLSGLYAFGNADGNGIRGSDRCRNGDRRGRLRHAAVDLRDQFPKAILKAGAAGFVSLFVGIASSYTMGAIVALAFGYRDAVSVSNIAAGAVTFVVGPVTGQTLGADSTVIALSVAAGLIKTIFIMILTPFVAKHVGITNPKMAMIYGGLVGSTSGVSTGLAAADPELVPYGTMIATFYSGFGCLLCPSLMYGITKLLFAI